MLILETLAQTIRTETTIFLVICDILLSHLPEKRNKTLSEQPIVFAGATQIAEVAINPL